MAKRGIFQFGLRWTLLGVIAACIVIWYVTRETLPREIRIATAEKGGLYHRVGARLQKHLAARTGHTVVLVPTKGSRENGELLRQGKVHLAILQAGAVSTQGLAVVAPLYPEPVHLLVRKGRGIVSVKDLKGRHVSLGPHGSGMRESATTVLEHGGIGPQSLQDNTRYFKELSSRKEMDAAVVTTGMLNHDLHELMRDGEFDLLPLVNARALAIHHPYFTPITIPRGLFRPDPPVPEHPVETVAATAVLAVHEEAPAILVEAALATLYEDYLSVEGPSLIPAREAKEWDLLPVHPAARSYYDPYEGIGLLANLLEGLAGIKEVLFALGAGLYLLWLRRRRTQAEQNLRLLQTQREALEKLMDETVRIERAQMDCTDADRLEGYLDEVTLLKLEALGELSHADLRGDRLFLIFLTQCANLIRKIQSRLIQYRA